MKTVHSIIGCGGTGTDQVLKEATAKRIGKPKWKIYSYEELHEATNGFHKENRLGEGLFGTIFWGKTADGLQIAVRKLKFMNSQAQLQFATEVDVSARVRHRNLLGFRGFCAETDYPLIVYDFMPNLCLRSHLHGRFSQACQLTWKKRMRIAIGIAEGLRYLHHEAIPTVIHRDIKASNILLNSHWEPVVADFRFARLIPEDVSHVTARVKGTLGYLAPEYAMLGKVTESCDVYSFGILLMELVTGRKPIEKLPGGEIRKITEWAKLSIVEERYRDLVDQRLRGHYNERQLKQAVNVATLCVQKEPEKRPTMEEVICLLRRFNPNVREMQSGNEVEECDEEDIMKDEAQDSNEEIDENPLRRRAHSIPKKNGQWKNVFRIVHLCSKIH